MKKIFIFLFIFLCTLGVLVWAQETAQQNEQKSLNQNEKVLSLEDFVVLATKKDTVFEKILINELYLAYQKDLNLPSRDLVLSVKGQYDFFLNQDRDEIAGSIALSKLFPYTGTSLEAEYTTSPAYTTRDNASDFAFTISQPIAQNAFGKAKDALRKN